MKSYTAKNGTTVAFSADFPPVAIFEHKESGQGFVIFSQTELDRFFDNRDPDDWERIK